MAFRRVTMQDIAEACGLSRNTVSKVFNGRGVVQEETKRLVLEKAKELGYNQLPLMLLQSVEADADNKAAGTVGAAPISEGVSENHPAVPEMARTITVLSKSNPLNHNFGSLFIKNFTDRICRNGYTVQLYEISEDELANCQLPPHISLATTSGILGIELFDQKYIEMVCGLGLPTLFIDGYLDANRTTYKSDVISMECIASTSELTEKLIEAGAKSIGFVGDIDHCNSFHERWGGFSIAMRRAELPINEDVCILAPDASPYWNIEWLVEQLEKMPFIPDAFVCANDYHAINMMVALRQMNLSIPKDVMITGFDDSPESRIVDPPLTTVYIPAKEMGLMAAGMLLNRIAEPDSPYSFSYVQTKTVIRQSIR